MKLCTDLDAEAGTGEAATDSEPSPEEEMEKLGDLE